MQVLLLLFQLSVIITYYIAQLSREIVFLEQRKLAGIQLEQGIFLMDQFLIFSFCFFVCFEVNDKGFAYTW